ARQQQARLRRLADQLSQVHALNRTSRTPSYWTQAFAPTDDDSRTVTLLFQSTRHDPDHPGVPPLPPVHHGAGIGPLLQPRLHLLDRSFLDAGFDFLAFLVLEVELFGELDRLRAIIRRQ